LGTAEETTTYESLVPDSSWLLEIKRKLKRPKDQLMVLQIEAALDELKKSR
jgi:hypothetical protein